jgi:protein-S-isoprenylcysteine O-methyltransferase Ste14
MTASQNRSRDASSPFVWPPVIYGTAALAAAVASWLAPWPVQPVAARPLLLAAGVAVFCVGAIVALAAEWQFKATGTAILPTRPTTSIVSTGVYRFTRNPMYLGMSLGLIGAALGFDQLWFLLALPFAMLLVTKLAIEREEAYLTAKFGDAYLAYKAKVRRWV